MIAGRKQRHDHLAQRAHGGRAQCRRCLVQRLVDLRKCCDAGTHAHRHVAEHETQHEDEHAAGQFERRHVERDDVRHADHRAGNGEAHQRQELEGTPAGETVPRDHVGGEQAHDRRERRGDGRHFHRGEEAVPCRPGEPRQRASPFNTETLGEMMQCQRHVAAADVLHEPAGQDDHVADDRENDPERRHPQARELERPRQLRGNAAVTLPRHRDVGQTAEPALLQPEGEHREAKQHHRERRGAARIVLRAGHREEDLGGQHVEVAGQHDRIAEVGEALDEAQQERIGQRRPQERPGDRAEYAPTRRAQRLRRLLERRADRRQGAVQDHERDRRERKQLRDRHAGQAVDPARAWNAEPGVEQPGDDAGAPEQHDQRQREHERRRDEREDRHQLGDARIALPAALHDERQQQSEQRRADADDGRQQRRIDRHAAAGAAGEAARCPRCHQ